MNVRIAAFVKKHNEALFSLDRGRIEKYEHLVVMTDGK